MTLTRQRFLVGIKGGSFLPGRLRSRDVIGVACCQRFSWFFDDNSYVISVAKSDGGDQLSNKSLAC
jgi:hypothetical protein